MENGHTKLKRVLGFPASYGAAVGLVVSGTAMFSVANVAGTSGFATFISSAIALVPIMAAAFAFGELTAMIPGGGMISDYTNPALGKFFATFSILSCYVMLIACDGGSQLVMGGMSLEAMSGIPQLIVSLTLLMIALLINIFDVGMYGKVESLATVAMMVIFFIMAIAGTARVGESMGVAHVVNTEFMPEGGMQAVLGTVGAAIWFFIGFEFACPMAEENRKPYKNIPYALILGLLSIYLVDNIFVWGAVRYTDLSVLTVSSTPQVDAAEATLGTIGGYTMSVLTILASFTTNNAYVAALPRMLYGMARDKQIPAVFGRVHPKYRVPMVGTFATFALVLVTTLYLTYEGGSAEAINSFINAACITWVVTYIIAMLDVLVLRKRYPDFPRLWKAPAAKITLPIGIIGSIYAISTLSYVLPVACIVMAVVAIYTVVWNKVHGMPINEVVPLEDCIKMIRERTEYCEGWDEAVVEWLSKRDAL